MISCEQNQGDDVSHTITHWSDTPASKAQGEEVFVTAYEKSGRKSTVVGLLKVLGREVYGAILDPDAEGPYEISDGYIATCNLMMKLSGTFQRMEVWRNGVKDGEKHEVLADHRNLEVTLTNDEQLTITVHYSGSDAPY